MAWSTPHEKSKLCDEKRIPPKIAHHVAWKSMILNREIFNEKSIILWDKKMYCEFLLWFRQNSIELWKRCYMGNRHDCSWQVAKSESHAYDGPGELFISHSSTYFPQQAWKELASTRIFATMHLGPGPPYVFTLRSRLQSMAISGWWDEPIAFATVVYLSSWRWRYAHMG